MAVPASISDLDDNAANNFPQDSDLTGGTVASLPRNHGAIIKKQFIRGTDITVIASGALTIPDDNSYFVVAGTGYTLSGFDDCFNGRIVTIKFSAILVLTNSASFAMPTDANITTEAGDVATFVNESAGVWRCISYDRAIMDKAIADGATASESYTDAAVAALLEAGTKVVFYQAAAPTGWTQDTTKNNYTLRVVSGSGGGDGGTHEINSPPSTSHSHTGPSHTHTYAGTSSTASSSPSNGVQFAGGSNYHDHDVAGTTASSGTGSTSAASPTAFSPKYIDVVIGIKD